MQSHTIGTSSAYIDEVRLYPSKARMTTTTYLQGVGKSSETDVNGRTTYYEYDNFRRLKAIRDNDRNLIESYRHHDAKKL